MLAEQKEVVYFPLYLITGSEYADNLFPGKEERVMLKENTVDKDHAAYFVEIQIGQNYLLSNGSYVPVSVPAYIDKNGIAMLPFRDVTESLGGSVPIEYGSEGRRVIVQTASKKIVLPVEGTQYFMNGMPVSCFAPIVIQNEKVFLSAEDITAVESGHLGVFVSYKL